MSGRARCARALMRAIAADHARFLAPLDVTTLRWSRQYTPRAWAAALLTRADNNTLPDTATEAVALAEHDLHDTDAATWTTATLHAAANLVHCNDSSPLRMATAVLTNHATKRCNETPPANTPNADEYRYSPSTTSAACPTHPGCAIVRHAGHGIGTMVLLLKLRCKWAESQASTNEFSASSHCALLRGCGSRNSGNRCTISRTQ